MQSNIELTCKNILNDLAVHHKTREELLTYFIANRLEKSIRTYYKHINDSYEYLSNCNSIKMAKRLNK